MKVKVTREDILKAIEARESAAPFSPVTDRCPFWQALKREKLFTEEFRVGLGIITNCWSSSIEFHPQLPPELYTSAGWKTALENLDAGAVYEFEL